MNRQQGRKAILWLFAVVLMCTSIFNGTLVYGQKAELQLTGSNQVGNPLELISTEILGEGVVTGKYKKVIGSNTSTVHITSVDLNNPYTEIVPLYGKEGKITPRQNVKALADQKEDVVAAINADFFHMTKIGTPFGIVLDQGELVSSMGRLEGWNSLGITNDRRAIIDHFGFSGQIKAPSAETFPIFGVNKEPYNSTQGNSHENRLHLFTPAWGTKIPTSFDYLNEYVILSFKDNMVIRIEENAWARTFLYDEQILWGHGQAATFLKEKFKVGDPIEVGMQTGKEAFDLYTAVGGHALLVNSGQVRPTIYPKITGEHARSAVGISQDGKTVYLVAVEKHDKSKGMTLENLARLMIEIGAYKAANLDGGGSTTVVGRKLGDFETSLLNIPQNGTMRAIPTGIGVVNTAPTGDLAGLQISGDYYVFKGDSLTFSAKGYDEHYHPYKLDDSLLEWTAPEDLGSFEGSTFFAGKRGQTEVAAHLQGVRATKPVHVLGGEDIRDLEITPKSLDVIEGQSKSIEIAAIVNQGTRYELKKENIDQIEVTPSELGIIEGLTFTGLQEGEGTVTIHIDGLQRSIPVRVGSVEHPWPVIDTLTNLHYTGHPTSLSTKGNFRLSQGDEPVQHGKHSASLAYNFEGASAGDVRIAYGQLGSGGISLPAKPIGLGVWIYGDNSNHWARALVTGADGKDHYVDLAKEVDWTGWKYTQGQFPSVLKYPATLKSLYLVNAAEGSTSRPAVGTVYFDGITLLYPYGTVDLPQFDQIPVQSPVDSGNGAENNPFKDLENHWSKPYVLPLTSQGIIKGMSADQFMPEGKITRAQLATLLDRMFAWGLDESKPNPYQEALPDYAERSIRAAHQHEVMQAFNDGTFRANEPVTRAQLALYLHRVLQTNLEGTITYKDQQAIPDWAQEPVKQMALLGILEGNDKNQFLPNQHVTRAQVATVLYRLSHQ